MSPTEGLVAHCLELLAPLGTASAQRMFGGCGLRIDGVFMGLIAFDRLYLKVDAMTRPQFEAAGCEAFVYEAKGRRVALGYWSAPPQALDSPEDMRAWARLALQAALRARSRPATPKVRKRSEKMPCAAASKR
ncbi:MAG TPA: TfoX/Sxy family protein [Rubrivivax sp.]|nr:TfoX/Sxy family protein [Rubrivivax sp.]